MSIHGSVLLSALVALSLVGCLSTKAVDLEGKACPCAEGWTCDPSTMTCIENAGGTDGGGGRDTGGGTDAGGDTSTAADTGTPPDGGAMDTGAMPGAVMIWEEAEDGTLEAPMAAGDDATASGGQYVASDVAGDDGTIPGPTGKTSIGITIPAGEGGTYRIWGRVQTGPVGVDDPNSFWVCVDAPSPPAAADCIQWNSIETTETLDWRFVHPTPVDAPVATDFDLVEGAHTIEIYRREAGTRIDKILVTNDLAFTPTGLGG